MMILDTIAQSSRMRVKKSKERFSLEELKVLIYDGEQILNLHSRQAFAFEIALKKDNISFICEVKKASPSKGVIAEDFPYQTIAKEYEEAGSDAISVLTEPDFFKGSNQYLTDISSQANIPILRKDFTIDEYQIYEAKVIGADAVLLICTLLNFETLKKYLRICDELGLSALVEAHTRDEVLSAVEAGARVIGVNNRNLQTFEININNSINLRSLVPKDITYIAESGIRNVQDIRLLKAAGVNAVLIGETLMKSENKKEMLSYLRG